MKRHHLQILALSLAILGIGLALYKALALHFPISPDVASPIWNAEAQVRFVAQNRSTQVSLFIPRSTENSAVMDESFVSRGFGLTTESSAGNRHATWSIRKAIGQHTLYYRAVVRQLDTGKFVVSSKSPELTPTTLAGSELAAAEGIVSEIKAQSADLDSLVAELSKRLNRSPADDNVATLLGKRPSSEKRVKAAVEILTVGQIPARAVHGVRLVEEGRNVPIEHWVEVYQDKSWRAFSLDPSVPEITAEYLPWWRGSEPIAGLKDGSKLNVALSVSRHEESAVDSAVEGSRIASPMLLQFSLFSLPIATQSVYKILLLVPIGALLLVLIRNVVGIETFGTFMPVLIALAFRETQLIWGVTLFVFLIALGLLVRFYLEHLKLLLVPRLAAVLTVVVLMMMAVSILTHRLDIERGLSVALFPMIIITMTIERMSIVWEELGAYDAIKRGLGSLVSAILVYLVFSLHYLQHLLFVFPELLLVVLALTLLMGRYKGYRLMELYRFRELAKE